MTKEEAIKILMDGELNPCVAEDREACDMAIKALEQIDILDKIRDEIEEVIQEETVIDQSGGEYERIISKLDPDDVLQIIDKYRK